MSARVPGPGLAWSYALKKYGAGIAVKETPALAISSTTPTQILTNNPDRVFWVVMNLSPYYGVIAFTNKVTLLAGLIISGVGGYASSSVDEDGEVTTYPMYALESVAGQTWYIVEIVHS